MQERTTKRAVGIGTLRGLAALAAVAASAGCQGAGWSRSATVLAHELRANPNPNERFRDYEKLVQSVRRASNESKAQAVRILVDGLEPGREPMATRAVICRGLGEIGGPDSRAALVKVVQETERPERTKPGLMAAMEDESLRLEREAMVRAEACRALGKVGQPEDATLLTRIMVADTVNDCRIAAIDGLGDLRANDPRVFRVLIGGMESEDPAVRLASHQSLCKATGKDLGLESKPWNEWLDRQSPAATPPKSGAASPPPSQDPKSPTAHGQSHAGSAGI